MTYIPIGTPSITATATVAATSDALNYVIGLAPPKVGYYWWQYYMAIPNSSGGVVEVRVDITGVGTVYYGSADESGDAGMYINHMAIGTLYGAPLGPGNVLYVLVAKAGRPSFNVSAQLVFIP